MTINERVREIRKAKDLTMEEFGLKIGVGKTAISKIESGDRGVTDQMFRSICREFGVREDWLRTGEGEMLAPEPVDEIEAICREHGLGRDAYIMIEKFIALPADQRRAILDYIRSVTDAFAKEAGQEQAAHGTEELEAAYRKSLASAPSMASSASNITEDTA